MKVRLVVPTRERAAWLQSCKYSTLPLTRHMRPEMFVRHDDSQRDAYMNWARELEVPCTVYDASNVFGAAQTYDVLIERSIADGDDVLIMLDDDMLFQIEDPIVGEKPYRHAKPNELARLMTLASQVVCPEMPAMSLTPFMTRSVTELGIIVYAKRLVCSNFFWIPHFAKHPEHRFWQGKANEARCDLRLALHLLTDGYLTGFYTGLFIPDVVNNPGGCSTYRTLDLERVSVEQLRQQYPDFVRLRKKLGWTDDPLVERDAPVIAWRKAFNRERFQANFGKSASTFSLEHHRVHQTAYNQFAKEVCAENAT